MFRFKWANRTSTFSELTSFKSLFSVKFQAPTLDVSHHLLLHLSCKSACENRDAFKSKSCCMLFATTIAVEQEFIVAATMIALFIFTRY